MEWRSTYEGGTYLILHRIAVKRDARYKGLGSEIISRIEKQFNNLGKKYLRLDCVASNEKLNKYYSESGFNKIGVNHNHSMYQKLLL